jgi:hypothetical protein
MDVLVHRFLFEKDADARNKSAHDEWLQAVRLG